MTFDRSRRQFLGATATLAVVGLAGCGDDGDSGTDTPTDGSDDSEDAPDAVDSYLSEATNYDGTIADETGSDTVTVEVGVGENNWGYGPAAVRIDSGTTVKFEWTGEGGAHNVKAAEDSDFDLDSGSTEDTSGVAYEFPFEETGLATYYCVPHQSAGMLGAIEVV